MTRRLIRLNDAHNVCYIIHTSALVIHPPIISVVQLKSSTRSSTSDSPPVRQRSTKFGSIGQGRQKEEPAKWDTSMRGQKSSRLPWFNWLRAIACQPPDLVSIYIPGV